MRQFHNDIMSHFHKLCKLPGQEGYKVTKWESFDFFNFPADSGKLSVFTVTVSRHGPRDVFREEQQSQKAAGERRRPFTDKPAYL